MPTHSWQKLKQTCLVKQSQAAESMPVKLHPRRFLSVGCQQKDIAQFIEQAYTFHTTLKFTAEVSEKNTVVYKEERFQKGCILHYKQTDTYSSCHPPGFKRGFIKGDSYSQISTTKLLENNFLQSHIQLQNTA